MLLRRLRKFRFMLHQTLSFSIKVGIMTTMMMRI